MGKNLLVKVGLLVAAAVITLGVSLGLIISYNNKNAANNNNNTANYEDEKDNTVVTKFSVAYNANGGSAVAIANIVKDEKIAESPTTTKAGYTFGGWYRETALTTAWDFENDTVTQNTTLYAKWTANTYSIIYDKNAPANASASGTTVTSAHIYDTAKNLTKNNYYCPGWTFSGWAAAADGEKVYGDGASVQNLTDAASGEVTLYAVWIRDKGRILLLNYYGDWAAEHETGLVTLPTPERDNCTFVAWYTNEELTAGETAGGARVSVVKDTIKIYYAKWILQQPNDWTAAETAEEIPAANGEYNYTFYYIDIIEWTGTGAIAIIPATYANLLVRVREAAFADNTHVKAIVFTNISTAIVADENDPDNRLDLSGTGVKVFFSAPALPGVYAGAGTDAWAGFERFITVNEGLYDKTYALCTVGNMKFAVLVNTVTGSAGADTIPDGYLPM
jgi:uncharacterized repeat protein (TIGR02543 family)